MTRLMHSPGAYRRLMQMSEAVLFVFVEGWTDRTFYDQICTAALAAGDVKYEVRTADELLGQSGGKQKLIAFYEQLRASGGLLETFQGKTSTVLFFLDKDLDDLTGDMITEDDHVVYTEGYHVENYWYKHGDITRAALMASRLDSASVRQRIGEHSSWLCAAAEQWKEWVVLCVHAHLDGIRCVTNYAVHSQVHRGCYGGLERSKYEATISTMKAKAGMSDDDFASRQQTVTDFVESEYRAANHDSIFKGRWYSEFLVASMRSAAGGRRYADGNFKRAVEDTLLMTLRFDAPWAHHLRAPVRSLAQRAAEAASG